VLQTLLALLLVVGCAGYATWTLLPAGGRRGIARALLKRPLPRPAAGFFRRHAMASASYGCVTCERNPASAPETGRPPAQGTPLVFHRRRTD
jgi:hypothetical protein